MKSDLLQLVLETKKFLQLKGVKPEIPLKQTAKKRSSPPVTESIIAQPVVRIQPAPRPKIVPKTPSPLQGNWELNALNQVEDDLTLRHKLESYCTTLEAVVPIKLFFSENQPSHLLFLESVARALTALYLPARVLSVQTLPLKFSQTKMILAPVSLLIKRFAQVQSHQVFLVDGISFIPLENLDVYTDNLNAKRALWQAIQHTFRS